MINVSENYKYAVRQLAVERASYIDDGIDKITGDDDLQVIKLKVNGSMLKSIMRYGEAQFLGNHNYLGKTISIGSGVRTLDITDKGNATITIADPAVMSLTAHGMNKGDQIKFSTTGDLPTGLNTDDIFYISPIDLDSFNVSTSAENAYNDIFIETTGSQSGTHSVDYYPIDLNGDFEYIDYGTFIVESQETNQNTGVTTIKFSDKMVESMTLYDLEPAYPVTVKQFLELICNRFDWTLATTTFPNDSQSISEELFSEQNLTFREILNQIAETSASIILFNNDDELEVRQLSHDTTTDDVDQYSLEKLKVENQYGPINAVTLARTPQEDNISQLESGGSASAGLDYKEIKIENNSIMDGDRQTFITEIYNELFGFSFYPFKATTFGMGYFEIGDRVLLEDHNNNQFEVIIFDIDINITGDMTEILKADIPPQAVTAYQYAGIIGREIKNTQIIVDKQNGEILLINEATSNLQTQLTTLEQQVDSITVTAQTLGGSNLLRNSVGLKGDIKAWQVYSGEVLVDSRNQGTIVNSTDVQHNSESGSGIQIDNQFITQSFSTIADEQYTFYCRFKKTGTLKVNITGVGTVNITASGVSDGEWGVYKLQFYASGDETTIRIENGAATTAILTDNVVKLGDTDGWEQAPNEVYGSNYRFDQDGFEISSLTDPFKSVLDNEKLAVFDTTSGERIVMLVSKDAGRITKLTAQDELVVQRYENPKASLRMIPVDDGAMIVIND